MTSVRFTSREAGRFNGQDNPGGVPGNRLDPSTVKGWQAERSGVPVYTEPRPEAEQVTGWRAKQVGGCRPRAFRQVVRGCYGLPAPEGRLSADRRKAAL